LGWLDLLWAIGLGLCTRKSSKLKRLEEMCHHIFAAGHLRSHVDMADMKYRPHISSLLIYGSGTYTELNK
jgi:hypothetical protein